MIMFNLAKLWLNMVPLSRSWQDLDKIIMVCHCSYQGYHVKYSIEPLSVINRVPSWKACL